MKQTLIKFLTIYMISITVLITFILFFVVINKLDVIYLNTLTQAIVDYLVGNIGDMLLLTFALLFPTTDILSKVKLKKTTD